MQSVSPVFTEEEVQFERVIALDQPQYQPVVALHMNMNVRVHPETGETELLENFMMAIRMRLTDDERKAIADGADLIVTELNWGKPFTPINIQVCQPGERPLL